MKKPAKRPLLSQAPIDLARIRRFVDGTGTVPIADVQRLLDVLGSRLSCGCVLSPGCPYHASVRESPAQKQRMAAYLRGRTGG